jgi:hypothetical protein
MQDQVMYAPGGLVKLIVSPQGPSADNVQQKALDSPGRRMAQLFQSFEYFFPTALLRSSSPVFASMLDGPWKESGEHAITITLFQPDVFQVFLDCLLLLANDTARSSGDSLIFSPSVIRKALPVAHYYQADILKQHIFSTVIQQSQGTELTSSIFTAAADSLFAVEASLPESEIPDWPEETLQKTVLVLLKISVVSDDSDKFIENDFKATTVIEYKPNDGINQLSKKTLKKCFQSLSLQIKQKLPGVRLENEADSHVKWPKLSCELLNVKPAAILIITTSGARRGRGGRGR